MPAFALTAAEIAAAEAAAIAAAEAAAIQAAQVAAAEAAAAAAAEAAAAQAATQAAAQAGTQAAAQAGTQAATQASTSGIQALAQEVGATVQPTGIEQVFQQAQANNVPMTQAEFLNNSFASNQLPSGFTSVTPGAESINPTLDPITNAQYIPSQTVPLTAVETPPLDVTAAAPAAPTPVQPAPQSTPTLYGSSTQLPTYGTEPVGPNLYPDITAQAPLGSSQQQQLLRGEADGTKNAYGEFYDNKYNPLQTPEPATGLQGLIDKSIAYAKDNPLQTGFGAMSLYNMLNQPKPYKKEKYKSTFDSSTYRPYEPTPPNPPYRPQYPQYAQGGLADLGGYADYAHGGRMLKGPGDGMSDDIPATIAGKQPARLANEEFVIPADVVSHLGNGSSEAGAKALYKMMDRVRQARTGNKKQGKQINPEKFLA